MRLHRLRPLLLVLAVLTAAGACRDDDQRTAPTTTAPATSTTTTEAPWATTTTVPEDLAPLLLTDGDLPDDFVASDGVDDTITSFCVGQDAAAGLRASSRAVVGFARETGGASVVQLAFRFDDDGAARFVAQAEAALEVCSGVPDGSGTGLAFEYEPLPEAVAAALGDAGEARTGALGTSVGSEAFVVEVAVLHDGDVGVLVAVLGLEEPRPALDELATTAFAAVAERLG
ncbi:MAG TPA: hypothetical protein VK007_01210 [Acidimicrobiales bacterium]|nr:hypothetical protein [Acidimicrobiales bacterium]